MGIYEYESIISTRPKNAIAGSTCYNGRMKTGGDTATSIGIIMDGNRRWAKAQGLQPWEGHKAGVDVFLDTVSWLEKTDVEHAAFYVFSSENWKRSEQEVEEIMKLLSHMLTDRYAEIIEKQIRVRFIGTLERLPKILQKHMKRLEDETIHHTRTAWICLSYGGRDELQSAARKISSLFGKFEQNLWSAELPDLDLVIRTGGNKRLSNFLLWKSAYAELYFTDILWPDFTKEELGKALYTYETSTQNMGA